jgi:hypothetical protein
MPLLSRMALLCVLAALAGCGGTDGPSTPQEAVAQYLAPWGDANLAGKGLSESEDKARDREFWNRLRKLVDPEVRGPASRRDEFGGAFALLTAETGEDSGLASPSRITGTPVSAVTHGSTSVVTVALRYEYDSSRTAASPSSATVRVLVVERGGAWWVATPQAFNPGAAAHGGLSDAELRAQHELLLHAAAAAK